jgi:hypothetical protein
MLTLLSRRVVALLVLMVPVFVAACGGGGGGRSTPTTPTTPTVVAPPVATPPVTPAPTVPATPFTGRWSGRYIIERCDGTGSVQDLLCGTARGLFPPGTALPITLDLTQSGSTVSGTIALGGITGVVTGAVRTTGLLTLSGVARGGTATATLTYWDTRAIGSAMDGFFNFNATYVNIPGVAAVSARLSDVRK